jgi:hypothetical protein
MNARKLSILLALLTAAAAPLAIAQLNVGGNGLDNCGEIDGLQSAGDYNDFPVADINAALQ